MISPGGITASMPGHPVAGDAVLEGVRAAGVAGDVAADLRDLCRARVGREAQAALAREPLDVAGGDARLDVHAPEQRIELAHLVQALETDHDPALDRDRAPASPVPPPRAVSGVSFS